MSAGLWGKSMQQNQQERTRAWYNHSYSAKGFPAQRQYPNEELCRFLGRTFGSLRRTERNRIRVLELGCGSCANLWMIAKEGFNAYGLDLSQSALRLGRKMLAKWGAKAELSAGTMTDLPYPDGFFDVVIDIFSSYYLPERDFAQCLTETWRVLRGGTVLFLLPLD